MLSMVFKHILAFNCYKYKLKHFLNPFKNVGKYFITHLKRISFFIRRYFFNSLLRLFLSYKNVFFLYISTILSFLLQSLQFFGLFSYNLVLFILIWLLLET